MTNFSKEQEKELLQKLKQDDNRAFQSLFNAYYKYLTVTAYRYLNDGEKAKDMAQDAFVELWNKRQTLQITTGLKPYLRQAVVNKCLNYLKREKRIDFSEPDVLPETPVAPSAQYNIEAEDTQSIIQSAVDSLPNKCRIIFCMSRFEEKSHQEIADTLNISKKTIENQITRALKVLRAALASSAMVSLLVFLACL